MKNFQITDVIHTAHILSLHTTSGSEILICKNVGLLVHLCFIVMVISKNCFIFSFESVTNNQIHHQ